MAYSVVFDVPKLSANTNMPFLKWYAQKERTDVLFSFSDHHGDTCKQIMLVPDSTGETASMLYLLDGDYVFTYVAAKLLIDVNRKKIYISSIIVDHECIFWGEINQITGGIKSFKKIQDHQDIMRTIVGKFFGDDWRFSLRYTKYHQKSYTKKDKLRIKMLDEKGVLNEDVYEQIINKMKNWNDSSHIITRDDMKYMNKLASDNIGVNYGFGIKYAWNKTIAVYKPVVSV